MHPLLLLRRGARCRVSASFRYIRQHAAFWAAATQTPPSPLFRLPPNVTAMWERRIASPRGSFSSAWDACGEEQSPSRRCSCHASEVTGRGKATPPTVDNRRRRPSPPRLRRAGERRRDSAAIFTDAKAVHLLNCTLRCDQKRGQRLIACRVTVVVIFLR